MKYDKGKWKVKNEERGQFIVGERYIAKVLDWANPIGASIYKAIDEQLAAESKANAYLIAAAPKLLEALNDLLEQTVNMDLRYGIELTEGETIARKKALAAIARATGK